MKPLAMRIGLLGYASALKRSLSSWTAINAMRGDSA